MIIRFLFLIALLSGAPISAHAQATRTLSFTTIQLSEIMSALKKQSDHASRDAILAIQQQIAAPQPAPKPPVCSSGGTSGNITITGGAGCTPAAPVVKK